MRDTKVVLKICKEYECQTLVNKMKDGFNLLGGIDSFIKHNHKVLIKADLYHSTHPDNAKTTHPNIVTALAEIVASIGAKCIIADSPKGDFKQSNLDNSYDKTQMLQSSNNGNATLNVNDGITIVNNPNGENSRDIYVMDVINEVDVIINVAKLRCDKYLGLSGCALNLFGLVPGQFKELVKTRCYTSKSFFNYTIDLYETLENKIVLNILDAIVGNESNNDPRILNALLIGQNPYSVDNVALKIINQNPKQSILLQESVRRGKNTFDFEILGDNLETIICSDFVYADVGTNIRRGNEKLLKRNYNRHQKRPVIPKNLCKGCKVCIDNCPMKAISVKSGQMGEYASVNYEKCVTCFKCVEACPYKVIKTKQPAKYRNINKMIKKMKNDNDD